MAKSDIVLDDDQIDVLGSVVLRPNESGASGLVEMHPGRGNVRIGGEDSEGDVVVQNADGENRIHLDGGGDNAAESAAAVYANPFGTLRLGLDEEDEEEEDDDVSVGGAGEGSLLLRDYDGENRVFITGGVSPIAENLGDLASDVLGGGDGEDDEAESGPMRVRLDGGEATLTLGGAEFAGTIELRDPDSGGDDGPQIQLDASPDADAPIVVDGVDLMGYVRDLESRIEALEG